jgi:hypothetical protein
MKPRFSLVVLGSLLAAPLVHAGDPVKAKQLMTLMRADEVVANAMKTGLRSKKAEIGLTDAQIACLNAVPHSEFSDVVTTAIADGLNDEELAAALTFYRTPAGTDYVKSIVTLMQGGARPPPLSDADATSVRDFANSPTGDKLLKKALIPNSNVVADKMAEVSANAIEDCGKAPAPPAAKKSP